MSWDEKDVSRAGAAKLDGWEVRAGDGLREKMSMVTKRKH